MTQESTPLKMRLKQKKTHMSLMVHFVRIIIFEKENWNLN